MHCQYLSLHCQLVLSCLCFVHSPLSQLSLIPGESWFFYSYRVVTAPCNTAGVLEPTADPQAFQVGLLWCEGGQKERSTSLAWVSMGPGGCCAPQAPSRAPAIHYNVLTRCLLICTLRPR